MQDDSAHLPAGGGGEKPGPGDEDGAEGGSRSGPRVDQLLKAALQEQQREQAGFMRVLQASRDALNDTRVELDHLRALVEDRDEALLAEVDRRLDRVARQEAMDELAANSGLAANELAALRTMVGTKLAAIDAAEARAGERLAVLAERIDGLEQLVGDTARAVTGELAASARRDEALAAALEERLAALEQTLDARQQDVAEAILKALDPVGRIMQLVQGRLARAASDLAVAQGSLLNRLLERDDRLELDRDRVLAELLNEFANGLKNRDRVRIGAQLLDADGERRRRRDLGRTRPRGGHPEPVAYSPQYLAPSSGGYPGPGTELASDHPWGAVFGRGDELVDAGDEDSHAPVERDAGGTRLASEWSAPIGGGGVEQDPITGGHPPDPPAHKRTRRGRRPAL
ncbi:MAG TPA: hypothetical protein VHA57_11415 [Actinomycetota bacterium]|nr:hypothetical protein [Actinomycetota bacterium]